MKKLIVISILISIGNLSFSQKGNWDVSSPEGDWGWKDVKFTTEEGTWMSVDVSPDGEMIAFDMLGEIYTMPISGGKATPIRQGIPWEVQPRFSPDGSKILFTSDAGGGDNIWVMNTDGSDAKQITKETFRLLNNADWMPDGNYFVARKHFTSGRSLGAGEMWMYHITGGNGYQLTKRKNDQQDVNEPSISPDGKSVYYSEDMYPGGFFQYNKDPNSQIYVINKYDVEKGESQRIMSGPGGAFRPQISPDGKKLAFIKRIRTKTVLGVQDLETGMEHMLFDQLSKDQQEAWAIFGVYPGFDWTPDGKSIIISGLGKIWKVDATTGDHVEIPFSADVDMKVAETITFKNEAFTPSFDAKVIRHLVTSPDGKNVIFNAIGHLWMQSLPDGTATRLTNDADFESEPSYSPDGQSIVYVTWDDENRGKVIKMNLLTKEKTNISKEKGIFRTPSFSNDGKMIVFRKDGGNGHQGFTYCQNPGIYLCDASGEDDPKLLTPHGEFPMFSKDDKRIFYQTGGYLFGSLTKSVESVDLNGQNKKQHFNGKYAQKYTISPDNEWVAWSELFKVYISPFPKTGKNVGLT